MPPTTRRVVLLLPAAATALALGACAGTPRTTPGTSRGARLDALRLEVAGGFTSAAAAFRTLPQLVLTSDGLVLTPAPVAEIYPGPLLSPLTSRTLDETGRTALAEVVGRSGLARTPTPDLGVPGVADAPTTTLTVTVGDATTRIAAPALDEALGDDPALTAEQQRLRAALRALVARLRDLPATVGAAHLGPEVAYAPTGVWLQALPAPTEGPDDPDDPVEPTVRDWPVEQVDLATLTRPTLVTGAVGAEVLAVLEDATELTWFRDDGAVHQLLARSALPGDGP